MSTPVCLLNEPCTTTTTVDLESLRRLDGLYVFYHEHWWCKLQMFTYFKKRNVILNGLALLTMASSIVVGSVWAHSYVAVGLTAFATLVKGWNDFKKYAFKMDMSKFAYTSYEKALGELRNYALSGIEDWTEFLTKMQTIDDVIVDFTPPTDDRYVQEYHRKYRHDPL